MANYFIQQIINLFKRNKQDEDKGSKRFFPLAVETIKTLADVRAKSTIDNYKTALRSFVHYAGDNLLLKSVDSHLIEGYQQWLVNNHVMHNSISCYMRSLRSLINQMPDVPKHLSLFDTIFTGKMRTDKRSITLDETVRIRNLQLPQRSLLTFSRDIFLFSFYALGMPFVDIAFLQKSQVRDGYVIYHRHKTGQRIRVKVEPPMKHIIDFYTMQNTPYVFPILYSRNKDQAMKEYETARSHYNRHLKKIGTMAGIQRTLTSYVARHSWASLAYHSNVDLSVISKALGHTSPNTTLTYIREIDDERIDQANHRLLEEIT